MSRFCLFPTPCRYGACGAPEPRPFGWYRSTFHQATRGPSHPPDPPPTVMARSKCSIKDSTPGGGTTAQTSSTSTSQPPPLPSSILRFGRGLSLASRCHCFAICHQVQAHVHVRGRVPRKKNTWYVFSQVPHVVVFSGFSGVCP